MTLCQISSWNCQGKFPRKLAFDSWLHVKVRAENRCVVFVEGQSGHGA
ncbi:hypothetical protein VCE7224_04265 [Vibrio celticus]|uniref:Uncharacterized protein n=1 Tax=Vibrio celticus TaxID=446372 RepID=A0A1C3JJT8_9VIBR|nr:hypothetical protein VCE7224_04265 [Vibrio celticus]